jgi:HEAT repeat protein
MRRWLVAAIVLLSGAPAVAQDERGLADWQRDLGHASVDVRARAAQALAAFDQRAVPALTDALGDREYLVRVSAAAALMKIGPRPVVPSMIDALRRKEAPVRANAAVVLGAFGPAAKLAVPALNRALTDANPRVRELAGEALGRITSTGPGQPIMFPMNCH